jgi:hypothetical protein
MLRRIESFMSFLQRARFTLGGLWGLFLAFAGASIVSAQSGYIPNGGEYAPAGYLPGDQTRPAIALTQTNGFLVWQDNITDGSGLGISAQALDGTFSPTFGVLHINQITAGDQERPQVAILNNGGKAVVWQGGQQSFQHIYACLLTPTNTFINANDIMVNTDTNHYQINPAIAPLANGNAVVTWASFGQDDPTDTNHVFQGVYAQLLSPIGQKLLSGDLLVNQFTPYNQRTPAVAAFPNGNFIVVWVSEKENSAVSLSSGYVVLGTRDSVDIYARIFDGNANPLTPEFLVNTDTNICANPSVAVASDNTFTIAWGENNLANPDNSWDVYARQFTSASNGGPVIVVNSQLYGDQYAPKIAALGTDYLCVWTSLGQDGSREGVFGQYLRAGTKLGSEFQVNTTFLNSQINPAVASDGNGRFLAVWSSFEEASLSMDIMAQRYINTNQLLSPPAPPVVNALDYYLLSVGWAPLAGFSVDHWNLYVDNSTTFSTTNIFWQNESANGPYTNDYSAGSTHTFQLAYVLSDGRESPYSTAASGTTWGDDRNNDGLPDNWETLYWGANKTNWPSSGTILTVGKLRATALQVFEWGANPTNASTWLVQTVAHTPEGYFLNWNTAVGGIYQVQSSPDLLTWTNLGAPRFAPGVSDSIFLGLSNSGYYRVMRLIY